MNEKMKGSYEPQVLIKAFEKKKNYSSPTLSKMGSMQRITLNGSQAPGDSGEGTAGFVNTNPQ